MSQIQTLLTPVFALMGLAFLVNVVLRNFYGKRAEQYAFGLLFGIVVVLGMTNPISLGEGLIFDTRTLFIAAAVAFVGYVAGAIALVIGIVCRIMIGGAGALTGVVGLLLAFLIAIFWSRQISPRIKNPILADALLGWAVTTSSVALFLLPYETAIGILKSITPTLLFCNVVGTIAVGLIFRREVRYVEETKALEAYARTDPLTNLLNRRGFDTSTRKERYDPQNGHALFYFDVDDFKEINDRYGHEAGDAALSIIASRISDSLRQGSIFSRQGGDEFSIYMPSICQSDVQGVADRICRIIAKDPIQHAGQQFRTAISVGGYWTKTDQALRDMIDRADAQLLLAKRAGKARAQVLYDCDGTLHAVA